MENVCELCQLYSPSGCAKLSKESCLKEALHILRGNVTNGDMIKTMFPNIVCETYEDDYGNKYVVWTLDGKNHHQFELAWWKAPYKTESEK